MASVTMPGQVGFPGESSSAGELDRATIERCRAGDRSAFRELVLRYERPVFVILFRLVGAGSHVEDLAQEVFWRAYRGLPRFDPTGSAKLSTWLFTIATRVAIDHRKRRRPSFVPLDGAQRASTPHTPETDRRRGELGRALARATAQLSDEQRDAFVLVELHGMTLDEAARALGTPAATIKTRLFRARERLRSLLSGIWEE